MKYKKYQAGEEIDEFSDERGWLVKALDYITGNLSSSEYKGAYHDLDKLIENADAKSEYSSLFKFQDNVMGRPTAVNYFRHLDPADSSVSIVAGLSDILYNRGIDDFDESTLIDAIGEHKKGTSTSKKEAARTLGFLRNKQYSPFPE